MVSRQVFGNRLDEAENLYICRFTSSLDGDGGHANRGKSNVAWTHFSKSQRERNLAGDYNPINADDLIMAAMGILFVLIARSH